MFQFLKPSRTPAALVALASGLLSAALKISLKPFFAEKASFIDWVLAARHPDSDPVCAKPTVMTLLEDPPPPLVAHPVRPTVTAPMTATAAKSFFIPQTSLFGARAQTELLWCIATVRCKRNVSLHIWGQRYGYLVTFR